MDPKELALTAAKALDDKKAKDLQVLKTADLTTLADYFVICSGTSTTQVKALADFCEKTLKDAGEMPHHTEGHGDGGWVLLDYSSVIVHVFMPEAREFYKLERLWNDAESVDMSKILPQE